jgi:tripartite-type tricarboxylate transporter receptor subunit TctC
MNPVRFLRRRLAKGLLAAGLMAAFAIPGFAQGTDYPQRPISLVVPFAAGGSLDVTARILADKLKGSLGQPVLVVNKPGAGSAVGARYVASQPADGYTLFFTSGSAFGYMHLLVPSFDLKVQDFEPVAAFAVNPAVIVSSTKLPVKSLGELVTYAQGHPGAISMCSTGAGGLNHLQLIMFEQAVKAKTGHAFAVTHVPYNGLAPALTGIREGSVQACVLPYTSLVKNMNGKDLRILAVQRGKRLPWLPEVPTTGEQGYPELDGNDQFVNVDAPKGTPQPVIAKLESAFKQAMQDPTVRKKLDNLEVMPVWLGSRDTEKWLEEDSKKYGALIRDAGLVAK